MTFYLCATILIELMMLAMMLHVIRYTGFTRQQKVWFILTFASVMVCAAAELAVHCGVYDKAFALPLTIITVIQFSLSPMLGVFFSGALGLHKAAKKAVLAFMLNALVEIAAAPFGLIFYFNDEGYFRGPFFIVYEIFYFVALIYLIVGMIIVGRKFRHRDFWTIAMVLVILATGIMLMTFFNIHIAYISIGICASLCYIYYNDLVQEDIEAELIADQEKISELQEHTISGLANLIESRDTETGEHVSRTCAYVKMIAENARREGIYADEIDDDFISLLYSLAPMHDVGKIIVPDRILKKPGKLTSEEFDKMKEHAAEGGSAVRRILKGVTDEDCMKFAADIATYHHERWDGTGYPKGLSGTQIPLAARIMAIADVYDALISERCYKKAIPVDEACRIIKDESGSHFDPKLASVFLEIVHDGADGQKRA